MNTPEIVIRRLNAADPIPWDLLLTADPSKEVVEKYLPHAESYIALLDNKVVGVYVLVKLGDDSVELKNIAIDMDHQGKGIGKQLVMDAIQKARTANYKTIEVGTGNSSFSQLALYQKCGFRIVGIEKDFFTKNYPEKIIENGIQCTDLIKLSIDL